MFPWIAALSLFFTIPSFAQEHPFPEDPIFELGCAIENLMNGLPTQALQHYQNASELIDSSRCSDMSIRFIISFGQAALYDFLGQREQCQAAIGAMFLATNGCEEEEEDVVEMLEQLHQNNENSLFYGQVVDILHYIATIAPSPDVQNLLLSLVDDIEEELYEPWD